MKRIDAYIKSNRFVEVIEDLHEIEGLTGVSVMDIKGFGRTRGKDEQVRIVDNNINWVPHVKLEIVCRDDLVEEVVGAIRKGAHTGLRADGKIYIYEALDAIRISTGERGEAAV